MQIQAVVLRMVAIIAALLSATACAVTVDDGDYAWAPGGTDLGVLYLQHFGGKNLYAKGQKVSGNARISGDVMMLRSVWYRDWGDLGVEPQFLVPIGQVRTGGTLAGVNATNGVGDLLLLFPVHFIKDLSGRNAFVIAPWLWLPTGHYDKRNGLNPFAENRWKFALQTGRSLKVSEQISLEIIGDVQVHGNNDDFGPTGATMKQQPLREFQTHVRYLFTPGTFVGAMVSHIEGGETRVNGVAQDDRQRLTKVLFSVGHFVTPDTQALFSIGKDISIRTGIKEDARFNFRLMKIF
jgi:hypothetical protein